jgi:hypothetical protein
MIFSHPPHEYLPQKSQCISSEDIFLSQKEQTIPLPNLGIFVYFATQKEINSV